MAGEQADGAHLAPRYEGGGLEALGDGSHRSALSRRSAEVVRTAWIEKGPRQQQRPILRGVSRSARSARAIHHPGALAPSKGEATKRKRSCRIWTRVSDSDFGG